MHVEAKEAGKKSEKKLTHEEKVWNKIYIHISNDKEIEYAYAHKMPIFSVILCIENVYSHVWMYCKNEFDSLLETKFFSRFVSMQKFTLFSFADVFEASTPLSKADENCFRLRS